MRNVQTHNLRDLSEREAHNINGGRNGQFDYGNVASAFSLGIGWGTLATVYEVTDAILGDPEENQEVSSTTEDSA